MELSIFDEKYKSFRGADKIDIDCEHNEHVGIRTRSIGKTAARRNISKHPEHLFICRECSSTYFNPMKNRDVERRQTGEKVEVTCPNCGRIRVMMKNCYFGVLEKPYIQICKSCKQKGKIITQEQRDKISETLNGKPFTEERKENLKKWYKDHPDDGRKDNLIPGIGGVMRKGLPLPEEWKENISKSLKGRQFSIEHRQNLSAGRKKMIKETGGFTKEHRERISDATLRQYQRGFHPESFRLNGWHYSTKLNHLVFFRSSYEKRAYMLLDESEEVVKYETEKVSVKYLNPVKEISSNYLIDLLVYYKDGSVALVEVKPEKWLSDPVIKSKVLAGHTKAAELNCKFEIWTEMNLYGPVDTEKKAKLFADKLREELDEDDRKRRESERQARN